MNDQPKYTFSKNSTRNIPPGRFLIFNDQNQVLKNHLGIPYPPLPKETAQVLVEELNEILAMDTYLEDGNASYKLTPNEVIKHPKYSEIRKHQEMQSFAICVQNTLLAIDDFDQFKLPIQELIQWDLLYRMSPGPIEKMEQIEIVYEAIQWLDTDWIDLPANYADSIQEMEAYEIPFVPEKIHNRLIAELERMSETEQIAIWYLYKFFQQYSITLPLLWAKEIITSPTLEDSYYVLASDFSPNEIRKIRKKEGDIVQQRLKYLRKYLVVNRSNKCKEKSFAP